MPNLKKMIKALLNEVEEDSPTLTQVWVILTRSKLSKNISNLSVEQEESLLQMMAEDNSIQLEVTALKPISAIDTTATEVKEKPVVANGRSK